MPADDTRRLPNQLGERAEEGIDLVRIGVEVRADAQPVAGAMVDPEFPLLERRGGIAGPREVHDDGAGAAVILGGIGNPWGALIGGLVVGISQELSTEWIDTGFKPGVPFAVLIVMLIIRPRGLFGSSI